MKAGKKLLVYSTLIVLLCSCKKNKELLAVSDLTWYDLDYDENSQLLDTQLDFLNEIFLEIENDSVKLVEILGSEVPTGFVFYSLIKRVSTNRWKFINKRFNKGMELELTQDTNLIIRRPLLTDSDNSSINTYYYIKQKESKKELRKIFLDYHAFTKKRRDRQYDILERSAIKYHILLQQKMR